MTRKAKNGRKSAEHEEVSCTMAGKLLGLCDSRIRQMLLNSELRGRHIPGGRAWLVSTASIKEELDRRQSLNTA
jgi:hypothetical protein